MYQYVSMSLAKTYTAVTRMIPLPVVAEVVVFFDVAALGLALAWLATLWATAGLAGRRVWDAALVGASPLVIFQIFTNFDALATAFAVGGLLAWARRRPVLAGLLIGLGGAAKLYPLLLLGPLLVLGIRTGRLREVARTAAAAVVTWLLVNLPVLLLFPRGWSEFFRLNARRGDDMDSLYNVVKSFTGWPGFDSGLGFMAAAADPEHRRAGAVRVVLRGNRLHRADGAAPAAVDPAGLPGGGGVPVDQQGVEPPVLAVAGAAGGPGAAAPADPVGVDDHRRAGVGATDVLPLQRARPWAARAVVHHHGAAARRRGAGAYARW